MLRLMQLCLVLLFLLYLSGLVLCVDEYSRYDFPPGFIFGAGTSAYQVEGAAHEDGRTPSVWDTFASQGAGGYGGASGDVTVDQYHKYKEDVQLMVETGLDAYRFSISWSRLIPNGRGPVNPKGLQYYNHLINELIGHGIEPHVTLFHYDLPQALEDEYGGWISRNIVKDFTAYADVCFEEFGDRVSYWTTVNEPNMFVPYAYDDGFLPPNRCSQPFGTFNCSKGNSSTEPYLALHHILLAHASAAKLYRTKYQGKQHGYIGISLNAVWMVPMTNSEEDIIAARRATDFYTGCIMHPLVFGDYPSVMKERAGSRIPGFTSKESKLVKNSFDYIGVLHYSQWYVENIPNSQGPKIRDFRGDVGANIIMTFNRTSGSWEPWQIPVVPSALRGVLEYFKESYGNPPIYIEENGQRTKRNVSLEDTPRVEFHRAYIGSLLEAVRNGSNTKGYFMWSLLDVLELMDGYQSAYGLYYVDLDDPNLTRYAKLSQHWYSDFLKGKSASSSHRVVEFGANYTTLTGRNAVASD